MQGADAHSFVIPLTPAFASREIAAEIAENYWMALLRDVPFENYRTNPIANAAAQPPRSNSAKQLLKTNQDAEKNRHS